MIVDDERQNQVQIFFDVTIFGGFLQNKLKMLCCYSELLFHSK